MRTPDVIGQTGRRLTARGSDNLTTSSERCRGIESAPAESRRRRDAGSPKMKQLGLGEVPEGAQEPA